MCDRFVSLSGCSGGGKSTLLAELRTRGHHVVEEPGRRVVKHELESGGDALPWIDEAAFARRAMQIALSDRKAAREQRGWVFFDRGLVDAISALEELTGDAVLQVLGARHRYHRKVFLAPPWREIYVTDAERRHGFEAGLAEFERLKYVYRTLGYQVIMLPKATVGERADFVLAALSGGWVEEGPSEGSEAGL
jgi:predicted ATPase